MIPSWDGRAPTLCAAMRTKEAPVVFCMDRRVLPQSWRSTNPPLFYTARKTYKNWEAYRLQILINTVGYCFLWASYVSIWCIGWFIWIYRRTWCQTWCFSAAASPQHLPSLVWSSQFYHPWTDFIINGRQN